MKQRHLEVLLDKEELKIYANSNMETVVDPINYSNSIYFAKEVENEGWDIYMQDGEAEPVLRGFINEENIRWCSECGYPMIAGAMDEMGWYACSEGCFNDAISVEEREKLAKQWEESGDADVYWTNWYEV